MHFKVHYRAVFGDSLYMVGSTASLGRWDLSQAVQLHWSPGDTWHATVALPAGCVATMLPLASCCLVSCLALPFAGEFSLRLASYACC